jgi:hypothetical protein
LAVKNNIFGTLGSLFEFGKFNKRVTFFTGVGESPRETVGTVGDFYVQAHPLDPGIWQKRVTGWERFARINEVAPGFYGITVGQTDDLGTFRGIQKINFNTDSFYITQNDPNTDEVVVNFRGTTAAAAAAADSRFHVQTFASSVEWEIGHNLSTAGVIWSAFDDAKEALIPLKVDISDTDTAFFYFSEAVAGTAAIAAAGAGSAPQKVSITFTSSVEWEVGHSLNTGDVIWSAYDNLSEALIPARVDTSDPNTAFFYFAEAVAGKAVIVG